MSHVKFDQWSRDMVVGSWGLVTILAWQGVSSARLQDQSSRKVGVRPLLMEPSTGQRHSWAAVTEQQPPRGACRKCGARPLSTANVAGGINSLICQTSIEHSACTYVVCEQIFDNFCQWITSLAGGSSCRGTVGWLDGAPSIQHSLRLKQPKILTTLLF